MKWLRRVMLLLVVGVAVFFTSALLVGCTTTVKPPTGVVDPVTVYVIDHGRTPSLLLPTAGDGAVRYAYGDWVYYAESKRHPIWHGAPALLWPTPAAVGRQPLGRMPEANAAAVARATNLDVEHLHDVVVERADAEALHRDLEQHFQQHWDQRLHNPSAALTFVPHPDRYSLPHDSNRMVGRWLEQMGAETRGPFWATDWHIEQP
ncbi:MAG: hypothetical protein WD294_03540 [Phycisphaeraceae bacterium]